MDATFDLATLAHAFSARISELRTFMHLRVDDKSQDAFQQELLGLEASIKALEAHMTDIRAYLQRESTTIPRVESLLEACSLQSEDIIGMAAAAGSSAPTCQKVQAPLALVNIVNRPEERRRRDPIPRWYITQAELDAVSSYMKGRLSVDKVNAAVDVIAGHAEATAKLLATMRSSSQKLSLADRKKATELLHSVAGREGIKGKAWFVESDLKDGTVLRLDKSSKAMLVLLRHLGRIQEARCPYEGATCTVFILVQPPLSSDT